MTDSTHEQQLQQLIDATTDLTEAVNVNKLVLDSAVDSATGSAQSAANASNIAVNAKEEAKIAVTEAKEAEANATAIVHNDEGHTTPTPGAYPVADINGHLDIGWTPLLAAMYPHSGIIGSVDKSDLFSFKQDSLDDADKLTLKARQFNIFGRFVDMAEVIITLAVAETTSERAIAFDDIFLDWNGNIQTYRSIIPHRTITGYDRDAIATEHGYTKIQTGLYKTGNTYALLLGRVARRNQGAYHPEFNPEGTRWPLATQSTINHWYKDTAIKLTNSTDAFNILHSTDGTDGPGAYQSSGFLKINRSGRPDEKLYDAIYADDFTPLYYSAKNVINQQTLLFDSFNRAVAGETFSGAEGCGWCKKECELAPNRTDSAPLRHTGIADHTSYIETKLLVVNKNDGKIFLCEIVQPYDVDITACRILPTGHDSFLMLPEWDMTGYTSSWDTSGKTDIYFSKHPELAIGARPQFLMVDIIGSLDAMPTEWFPDPDNYEVTKDRHIPGNWLTVGEEGESLIPDGTEKNYELSRKCMECYQVLSSGDKGVTWSDVTSNWKNFLEGSNNAKRSTQDAEQCLMIFYLTSANPFELTKNSHLTALGDVWANTRGNFPKLCLLGSHLIGKVTTSDSGYRQKTIPLSESNLDRIADGNCQLFGGNHAGGEPIHAPINLALHTPAIKTLPVLTKDGYMQIVYKEMKHNGTQWGDDNKFDIVDNQSTVTDLNGETVIVGQKRVELPYIFDGVTY